MLSVQTVHEPKAHSELQFRVMLQRRGPGNKNVHSFFLLLCTALPDLEDSTECGRLILEN